MKTSKIEMEIGFTAAGSAILDWTDIRRVPDK